MRIPCVIWIVFMSVILLVHPIAEATGKTQAEDAAEKPLGQYAPGDFFAGAVLNMDGIISSKSYSNIPFDIFLSSLVSFDRYRETSVSSIAVFIKNQMENHPFGSNGNEMAAAVRLKRKLGLKEVLAELDKTDFAVLRNPTRSLGSIEIAGYKCFRFPTGTFLHPIRKTGRLHFTKNGETIPHGFNVGDVTKSQYICGVDKREAVFTLDEISKQDLLDGKLILELRPATFHVSYSKDGSCSGQISLRRTDGGLSTNPIRFRPIEFRTSTIEFEQTLEGTNSTGEPTTINLLNDLVDKGKLQVVVTCDEDNEYIGFDADRLNIKNAACDFLVIKGRDLLLAQSESSMRSMLLQYQNRAATELGERLNHADKEIVVAAEITNVANRDSLICYLDAIRLNSFTCYLPPKFSLHGMLDVDEKMNAHLQVTVPEQVLATRIAKKLNLDFDAARQPAKDDAVGSFKRQMVMGNLVSLIMPEIPTFLAETKIDPATVVSRLQAIVGGLMDDITIDADGNAITIDFNQGSEFDIRSLPSQHAMASLELRYANFLKGEKRHSLSSRVHRLVTSRLGNNRGAWMRRAHEEAYNKSMEVGGSARNKYQWVRRGIEVLLDGHEAEPESVDLLWLSAKFIALKIGGSDERQQYQELFSKDAELHRRLARYIDIEKAKSDNRIESWLAARLLFQHCIDQRRKGKQSGIQPFRFYSGTWRAVTGFARELNTRDEFERSSSYWATAEDELRLFGDQLIGVLDGTEIRLNQFQDWKEVVTENRDHQQSRVFLQYHQNFQNWLWLAEFGRTEPAYVIGAHVRAAKSKSKRGDREGAHANYRLALLKILECHKQQPVRNEIFFFFYRDVFNSFMKGLETRKLAEDSQLAPLLKSFESVEKKPDFFTFFWF